jgi:hypothetical protein
VRDLLWKWRVHNRFALAWWAFCNPDNLTMLRHELDVFSQDARTGPTALGLRAAFWLERFLDIPVR